MGTQKDALYVSTRAVDNNKIEYFGVWSPEGVIAFRHGPLNTSELKASYLAIVHGLASLTKAGLNIPLVIHNAETMSLLHGGGISCDESESSDVANLLNRAQAWLSKNKVQHEVRLSVKKEKLHHFPKNIMIGKYRATPEQELVIELAATRKSLMVEAASGTGKTSTLIAIAEYAPPQFRGLYLAYNKAIADESSKHFPKQCTCRTAHSIAYSAVGHAYKDKLNGRIYAKDVAQALSVTNQFRLDRNAWSNLVIDTVQEFTYSADDEISDIHIKKNPTWIPAHDFRAEVAPLVVSYSQQLWQMMCDKNYKMPTTHDAYLKMWCLSKPDLDFDYILFDEAQDGNGNIIKLLSQQQSCVNWIGDRYQAIYGFRGAQNAMDIIQTDNYAQLRQSFRFGDAIAEVANKVLQKRLAAKLKVIGSPHKQSVVKELSLMNTDAVLCRTNSEAFTMLIKLLKCRRKVYVAGGVTDMLNLVSNIQGLILGKRARGDLASFKSFDELSEHSKTDAGRSLSSVIQLIEQYGVYELSATLNKVKNNTASDSDVTISSAHKSKGLEWDKVILADDFRTIDAPGYSDEESNLLYVAVTRAREVLDITRCEAAMSCL
jgi:hypothetical protein